MEYDLNSQDARPWLIRHQGEIVGRYATEHITDLLEVGRINDQADVAHFTTPDNWYPILRHPQFRQLFQQQSLKLSRESQRKPIAATSAKEEQIGQAPKVAEVHPNAVPAPKQVEEKSRDIHQVLQSVQQSLHVHHRSKVVGKEEGSDSWWKTAGKAYLLYLLLFALGAYGFRVILYPYVYWDISLLGGSFLVSLAYIWRYNLRI